MIVRDLAVLCRSVVFRLSLYEPCSLSSNGTTWNGRRTTTAERTTNDVNGERTTNGDRTANGVDDETDEVQLEEYERKLRISAAEFAKLPPLLELDAWLDARAAMFASAERGSNLMATEHLKARKPSPRALRFFFFVFFFVVAPARSCV